MLVVVRDYDGPAEIVQEGGRFPVAVDYESGDGESEAASWSGNYTAAGSAPWPLAGAATLVLPDGEQGLIDITFPDGDSYRGQGSFEGKGEPPTNT